MQHAKKNSVLANSHQLSHEARRKGLWGVRAYEDEQATVSPRDTKRTHSQRSMFVDVNKLTHTERDLQRCSTTFVHTCVHTRVPHAQP